MENINIERNKELFEYEMTEVILTLKGEYATFSGKDTKYAEIAVDDAKLHLCTPELVQVKMQDRIVQTPIIRSVQQVKPTFVETKVTTLKLPPLTKISDEDINGGESDLVEKKINFWQGILPILPTINKVAITNNTSELHLRKTEKGSLFHVVIPPLFTISNNASSRNEIAHINPISFPLPKMTKYHVIKSLNTVAVNYEKYEVCENNPKITYNLRTISSQSNEQIILQDYKKITVRVPHVTDSPQIDPKGKNNIVLSTVKREPILVDIPTISVLGLIEPKRPVISTNIRQVQIRKTQGFEHEIKKPKTIKKAIAVPFLPDIQTKGTNNVHTESQHISVPNIRNYIVKGKENSTRGVGLCGLRYDIVSLKLPLISDFSIDSSSFRIIRKMPEISKKIIPIVERLGIDVSVSNKEKIILDNIQIIVSEMFDSKARAHIRSRIKWEANYEQKLKASKVKWTNDKCIASHPLLLPKIQRFNLSRKDADVRRVELRVLLPAVVSPKLTKVKAISMNGNSVITMRNVPEISEKTIRKIQRTKVTISIPYKGANLSCNIRGVVNKKNIEKVNVPVVPNMEWEAVSAPDRCKQNIKIIDILQAKAIGKISKVKIVYHGSIIIPQKPEIGKFVDNIIALAVSRR